MDAPRFDRISKAFADRRLSRRQVLAQGGAGLAAAAAGLTATSAQSLSRAQGGGATPAPEPKEAQGTAAPSMLFLQTFRFGTITPVEGVEGRYTLTLEAGTGHTVYFSDRPERIVGADPTPDFLRGLGFFPDNPPNAALVVETSPGETDVAVVELFSPLYDPVGQGVIYEVEILADWQDTFKMGFSEAPTDLAALAPSFGSAQLFIDDCNNSNVGCFLKSPNDGEILYKGEFDDQPMCWNYSVCIPCEPYGHVQPDKCSTQNHWDAKCNQQFSECDGICYAVFSYPFANQMCWWS